MHRQHDELVVRDVRQHVAHEGELLLADQAAVLAAARLAGVVSEVVHVIEDDEGGVGVLERVVARAEHALPGLARVTVVAGLRVDVVVAGAVVPGNAGRGEHLEIAGIESEIVEDDVAVVDGEGGAAAQRAGNDVVAQIAELGTVLGLRVGEQQNLELWGLRPALQRKVDRDWKRTGWCHSGMSIVEVRRRSPRMVEVGELRQSAAARGRCSSAGA